MIERSLESATPGMRPWFWLKWEAGRDLTFAVGCSSKPHNPLAAARPDEFTAGLWRHDVGELFIKHAQNERYLEINLGPHGAWWACLFDGYRQAASDPERAPFEPAALVSAVTERSWETRVHVPADYLRATLKFGPGSCANVCFILGPGDGRHHFSWAPLPHDPPDFHHVEDFVPF